MKHNGSKIVAALAGLRASITRAELVERSGLDSRQVGGSLHALLQSGAVVAHPGPTKRTTGYTLDPEYAEAHLPAKTHMREKRSRAIRKNAQHGAVRDRDLSAPHAGNGLARRHVASTLALLTAILEIDTGDLREIALIAHREAIELLQAAA